MGVGVVWELRSCATVFGDAAGKLDGRIEGTLSILGRNRSRPPRNTRRQRGTEIDVAVPGPEAEVVIEGIDTLLDASLCLQEWHILLRSSSNSKVSVPTANDLNLSEIQ